MNSKSLTVNVMAPLVVGNPQAPDSTESQSAWSEFDRQLREIKKLGAEAVTTDVWWGLIEPAEGVFDWSYYDRLSNHIIAAGLNWIPILSFHQCGGNIGDTVTVLLPAWVWTKLARILNDNADAAKYVSEQGNSSNEYVSVWATQLVLGNYRAVMKAFQDHYAEKANHIAEINISLGPAGELRYPSYNSHDKGTDYPTRGALQAYSGLARKSFYDAIMRKYGDMSGVDRAWGKPLDPSGHKIEPPRDVEHFFKNQNHINGQYGRDFFDWYADSLLEHGHTVLTVALDVFGGEGAAFKGIDVGAKVPGVHWRMGFWKGNQVELADRLAELSAGLIRSSFNDWKDSNGWGYRPLVSLFNQVSKSSNTNRVVLHFTCLEMPDGDGAPGVNSLAYSLVRWVGKEAQRQGVTVKGENALNFHLYEKNCWDRIRSHLAFPGNNGAYEGITFLRMSDVLGSPVGRSEFGRLVSQVPPRFGSAA